MKPQSDCRCDTTKRKFRAPLAETSIAWPILTEPSRRSWAHNRTRSDFTSSFSAPTENCFSSGAMSRAQKSLPPRSSSRQLNVSWLVLRHAGINLVRPSVDSPLKIVNIRETALPQQSHRLSAALPAVAVHNDHPLTWQLVRPVGDFSERN